MKHSKAFHNAIAVLLFIVTLGVTFPAFADPDPNNFTLTYTWKNAETNTPAFPSVSQHFAEGQPYPVNHVSKFGYTIDNNNSYIVDKTGATPVSTSYATAIASVPNITSFDEYLDVANETGYIVQSGWNGTEAFFNTVLIPKDETVTINYVSSDGTQLDSKTIETKFGRTITIDQPNFDGHTIAANQPSSYKVDKDGAGANVVTVTYDPVASSSSESSSSSSSSSSSNGSSSSSSNSSNVASSSVSGSSSSSSSVTSNGQSSATSQSNSQSSNGQSIVATPVKEGSSNNSSNTPAQQTSKHDTSHHANLPNTSAIRYTTSIVGTIILAGITTLFVIKKHNH
ncbi:MucBP domain-containing protein [Furfurilactobacillus sp. WILCCON 0119]